MNKNDFYFAARNYMGEEINIFEIDTSIKKMDAETLLQYRLWAENNFEKSESAEIVRRRRIELGLPLDDFWNKTHKNLGLAKCYLSMVNKEIEKRSLHPTTIHIENYAEGDIIHGDKKINFGTDNNKILEMEFNDETLLNYLNNSRESGFTQVNEFILSCNPVPSNMEVYQMIHYLAYDTRRADTPNFIFSELKTGLHDDGGIGQKPPATLNNVPLLLKINQIGRSYLIEKKRDEKLESHKTINVETNYGSINQIETIKHSNLETVTSPSINASTKNDHSKNSLIKIIKWIGENIIIVVVTGIAVGLLVSYIAHISGWNK